MVDATLAIQQHARRANDRQFTLLCVDDESANLKILASIFKETYRIVACKSAKQAMEKALETEPDLILLDVIMPDESGFDFIVKLRQQPTLAMTPVIFISGLQSPEDEEKGLSLGACDYIQKPFNHGIVRARVNTHMEIIRQRKLLENFAHFDSLTELPNRRKWQTDSENLWRFAQEHQKKVVFGIIDIDCFKRYNDSYGHQQGDIVLRKVANAIRRVLFDYCGAIYRCGGEEFYFYLPTENNDNPQDILSKCLDAVIGLNIQHEASVASSVLTASIGAIAITPNADNSLEQVLKMADEKLYHVKQSTRNAVHFDDRTA